MIAIAALTLVAGLVAPTNDASGAAVAGRAGPEPVDAVTHNPNGTVLGVVPSRPTGPAAAAAPRAVTPNAVVQVTYHGGPVQRSNSVYAIFWAPASMPFPANYATTVAQYFTDVARDSFTAGNPYGADVQYFDGTGPSKRFLSYAVTFKGAFLDTRQYPSNACPNYLLGDGTTSQKCITRPQIANEIKSFVAAHKFPKGIGSTYFLFMPQRVASCTTSGALSSGGCYNPMNYPGYCAYHSFSGTGAQTMLFAAMHFANVTGCTSGQSPNGNDADSVINEISHEHQETMTDPLGTAWYDADGNEIADKCVFTFGAPLGSTSFGQYNQVINGNQYWLQQVWSNRAQACVQRNDYPQPTASFTFSPAAPAHGTPVSFHSTSQSGDGTALTFRWLFPNGTSSAANPAYVFASAGAKQVTLIVADTHGDQRKVTRTVTVH